MNIETNKGEKMKNTIAKIKNQINENSDGMMVIVNPTKNELKAISIMLEKNEAEYVFMLGAKFLKLK